MSTKLKKDIHKILVEDFSKAMGFNEDTGLLPNGEKRFSGMPFIGNDYGKFYSKILIVGEDIGRDECVNDNAKDINGTPLYFHDYLEDLSADMPSVEQWTEPLSAEVHYRWRPQKDCFYLDENIDDYLSELYEFVRK